MRIMRIVGSQIAAVVAIFSSSMVLNAQDSTVTAVARSPRIPEIAFTYDTQVDQKIKKVGGLGWQKSPSDPLGRFWISDQEKKKELVTLEPTTGRLEVRRVAARFKPGPLAVDVVFGDAEAIETRLWILDTSKHKFFSVIGRDQFGQERQIGRIRKSLPVLRFKPKVRRAPITGMAIFRKPGKEEDDTQLWVCRGGGLCSTIEVIDPENNGLLAKFFPRCEPIDIAIDPSGKRLWILADNGEDRGAVLIERSLEVQRGQHPWEVARAGTLGFRALPPEIRPVSIVATDDSVWVITEESHDSKEIKLGYPHLYQFPVGRTVE